MGQKSDKRKEVKNQQYLSLRCSPSKTNYWSCSSEECEDAVVTPEFPCRTWTGHRRQNRWKDIIQLISVDLQMLICARTFTLWDPFLLVQCTLWWKQVTSEHPRWETIKISAQGQLFWQWSKKTSIRAAQKFMWLLSRLHEFLMMLSLHCSSSPSALLHRYFWAHPDTVQALAPWIWTLNNIE